MIFVNLPVTDLERSKAFYTALGFTNDAQFNAWELTWMDPTALQG